MITQKRERETDRQTGRHFEILEWKRAIELLKDDIGVCFVITQNRERETDRQTDKQIHKDRVKERAREKER